MNLISTTYGIRIPVEGLEAIIVNYCCNRLVTDPIDLEFMTAQEIDHMETWVMSCIYPDETISRTFTSHADAIGAFKEITSNMGEKFEGYLLSKSQGILVPSADVKDILIDELDDPSSPCILRVRYNESQPITQSYASLKDAQEAFAEIHGLDKPSSTEDDIPF